MPWPGPMNVPEQPLDPPCPTPEEEARNERNEARQEAIEAVDKLIYALQDLSNKWFYETEHKELGLLKAAIQADKEEAP